MLPEAIYLQLYDIETYMKRLITNFEKENVAYASPMMAVLEICPEGVLCGSGTEEIEYIDGEW